MADDHGSGKRSSGLGWAILFGLLAVGIALQLLAPEGPHPDEAHHGFVFTENGFYIFDFIVFVVALVWFVRRPLRQALRRRRASIEREIDEARRLQAEARDTLGTYRDKLAGLEAEVERIRAQARADGETLKRKLVAEGEAQAKKLIEDAEARVRQETLLLRQRLEAELITVAAARAEALVTKGLTGEQQRHFVRDYVDQIEGLAAPGKPGRA